MLVVIFTFFYTLVVFNQQQLAENLQKNGGFVLGIRPGKPTQDYLNRVIVRITLGGALFLGTIAIHALYRIAHHRRSGYIPEQHQSLDHGWCRPGYLAST